MVATTIKRCAWVVVAMVALSAALAVLSPGIVEAQSPNNEAATVSPLPASDTGAQTQEEEYNAAVAPAMVQQQQQPAAYEEPATLWMVNPGDSLWAISEQRLQPDPSPEQIINEVGRIYELNQHLIGDDPNLIFPGQELLVPAVSKPAAMPAVSEQQQPAATLPEQEASEEATQEPEASEQQPAPEQAAPEQQPAPEEVAQEQAPEWLVSPEQEVPEEVVQGEQFPESIDSSETGAVSGKQTSEEDTPTVASRSVPPWPQDSYSEEYSEEEAGKQLLLRKLLGLGIIVLTFLGAILMLWKLPTSRNVGDPMTRGIYRGYYYQDQRPPGGSLETLKDLEEKKLPLAAEPLESGQEPNSPTGTENTASASVAREEEAVPSPPSARRRREQRLRRIHQQRTTRQRRQPPIW